MKGSTTGIADVYLDGEQVATIDLNSSVAAYDVNVWSTGILAEGDHVVRIVRSDANSALQVRHGGCRGDLGGDHGRAIAAGP